MGYCMQGGVLPMKLLAALRVTFFANGVWSVPPERGHEFRLRLKDHLALYGVKNAMLAPRYSEPDKKEKSNE